MEILTSPDRTRREGVEAFPVRLADGRAWGLALPSPRLRPEVVRGVDELGRPAPSIRLVSEFGYPLEIRRFIEGLRSSCEFGDQERQFEALICVAAALVRRAHEIDLTEAIALLELGVEDLPGFVEVVLAVVSGDLVHPDGSRKEGVDG